MNISGVLAGVAKQASRLGLVAMVCVVSNCQLSGHTGPEYDRLAGTYLLERFESSPLPRVLNSPTPCPNQIVYGRLDLVPQANETVPVYSLVVDMRSSCLTFQEQPITENFALDVGRWSPDDDNIRFDSDKGKGVVRGRVSELPNNPTIDFELDGLSYRWRKARDINAPVGTLVVSVIDETGQPVNGAIVEATEADGLITRGTTNNDRHFTTQSPTGSVVLQVAPPAGWMFDNPQQVLRAEVVSGATTELRIVLRRV